VLAHRLLAVNKETIKVLVAKEKMQQWDPIRDPDLKFREEEILVNDAPKGVFTVDRKAELKDRTLRKNIEEGDKLTADDLLPKDKNSLESQLTPGKRAWAIKITQDSGAGGFILPGSHVDVWHISREGGNRGNESKMVLENVLVRAIGLTPVRPEDRPGIIEPTATLELSPEEIEELAKVQDIGHLRLSLRPFGDNSTPGQKLSAKKQEVAQAVVPPPPPPPEAGSDTEKPKEAGLPIEPETITKTMTVFNNDKWIQRVYTLDKKTGEVLSSELRQTDMPSRPEPKPEVKTAPDTKSDKPKEESTN
jgi:Flp pilus assembly protein CpaB